MNLSVRPLETKVIYLDSVNGMYVLHTIQNNSSNFLKALVGTHNTDRAPLYENVALGQQFNCLASLEIKIED